MNDTFFNSAPSPVAPATGWRRKIAAGKKVQGGLLFLTANTYKRITVFEQPTPAKIFFRELDFYRNSYQFKLHGYILMPDHFHLLLDFPSEKIFADFLRDFKSSIGKLIIDWAKRGRHKKTSATSPAARQTQTVQRCPLSSFSTQQLCARCYLAIYV